MKEYQNKDWVSLKECLSKKDSSEGLTRNADIIMALTRVIREIIGSQLNIKLPRSKVGVDVYCGVDRYFSRGEINPDDPFEHNGNLYLGGKLYCEDGGYLVCEDQVSGLRRIIGSYPENDILISPDLLAKTMKDLESFSIFRDEQDKLEKNIPKAADCNSSGLLYPDEFVNKPDADKGGRFVQPDSLDENAKDAIKALVDFVKDVLLKKCVSMMISYDYVDFKGKDYNEVFQCFDAFYSGSKLLSQAVRKLVGGWSELDFRDIDGFQFLREPVGNILLDICAALRNSPAFSQKMNIGFRIDNRGVGLADFCNSLEKMFKKREIIRFILRRMDNNYWKGYLLARV